MIRVGIVGAGVVGLSCAKALASHADITVFEEAELMGGRSSGSSRIFRLAHRSAELVRLAQRARSIFEAWSAEYGAPLIRPSETVVTGSGIDEWASALGQAGVDHEVFSESVNLNLPITGLKAPSLRDPAGGVILVDRVRDFLTEPRSALVIPSRVTSILEEGGKVKVVTPDAAFVFDQVLLAAGETTPKLARQVGIDVPSKLQHHFRFGFAADGVDQFPAWISDVKGLSTYQHASGPDRWAIGAHFRGDEMSWNRARSVAEEIARAAVTSYAKEYLPFVEPRVVETVYCSINPDLNDGYYADSKGRVTALYGENLFKVAPAIGEIFADAILSGGRVSSLT